MTNRFRTTPEEAREERNNSGAGLMEIKREIERRKITEEFARWRAAGISTSALIDVLEILLERTR